VRLNKEEVSGITIHLVNEVYDEGKHLFQLSCDLEPEDDAEAIAAKVLVLEHQYYPQIVDQYLDNLDKKWSKT
jgi:phosphoribosylglycinamide formyltransferase-1